MNMLPVGVKVPIVTYDSVLGIAADSIRSPIGNSTPMPLQNWRTCDDPLYSISPVRQFRVFSLDHARVCRLAVGFASERTYQSPTSVVDQAQ